MRVLRQESFRQSAWKNGGGVSREIAREPAHSEAFDWRLSVARIDRSGPFSDFSGYLRTMVLLSGGGIRLTCGVEADRILTLPGEMTQFDGALSMHCELLDGPCTDLNLMVSRKFDVVDASVTPLPQPQSMRIASGESWVAFALGGTVVLEDAQGCCEALRLGDAALATGAKTLRVFGDDASSRLFVAWIRA